MPRQAEQSHVPLLARTFPGAQRFAVPARVHDYLDLAGCTYDNHPRVLAEHERRGQSTVFFRTAWDGSPWSDYSTPKIYGVTLHSRFKERE